MKLSFDKVAQSPLFASPSAATRREIVSMLVKRKIDAQRKEGCTKGKKTMRREKGSKIKVFDCR